MKMTEEEETPIEFTKEYVMIEYYTTTGVIKITREEVVVAASNVEKYLSNLNTDVSKFIAINHDVKQYCIPTLIKGIIDGGLAFVFQAEKPAINICAQLNVSLIFSHNVVSGTEILYEFNIHGTLILLLIYKDIKVTKVCPIISTGEVSRRFYYAIATSGSTGLPTIIKVTSKCIMLNVNDFASHLHIGYTDKVAQLTPVTFDPSIIELFLGIWNYCSLFMASNELKKDPQLLLDKMLESNVTIFQTTPSLLLSRWSKKTLKEKLLSKNTSLRVLVLGGEPCLNIDILSNIKHEENCTRFFSAYGITELSCWASLHEIIPGSKVLLETRTDCLGKLMAKTFFIVKNSKGKIINEGIGSLHVGSWDRLCEIDDQENILNEKLVRPLFRDSGDLVEIDGNENVFYIGRRDCLIKRFGNKVNLNNLEKCLMSSKLVEKCIAVWDKNEHKLHVCACPTSDVNDLMNFKSRLRHAILDTLSNFYQPDEIHLLKNVPLTDHGKICKQTLKKICALKLKPFQNIEATVTNVWNEYLKARSSDGFLSLGGTSLLALQMSNALSTLLDIELPELVSMFLKNSTLLECLALILNKIDEKKHTKQEMNETSVTKVTQVNGIKRKNKSSISEANGGTKFIWQKFRGYKKLSLDNSIIINLKTIKTYYLKRCVDASPTVFQYSSTQTFATIGSHSGIICTASLTNMNEYYHTELPDRIQASILVLSDFRGIVGSYDGYIYCIHLKNGQILWQFKTENIVKCSALICAHESLIFVGSYDKYMYCIKTDDGSEVWKTKVSGGSISAKARYYSEKDLVVVVTLDGTCAALERATGKIVWQRTQSAAIFSSPAILSNGDIVVCTVDGILSCFNIERDQQVWTYSVNLNVFSNLVVHNDPISNCENICFSAYDHFYRLECDTMEGVTAPILKYKVKLHTSTICTPWCEGDIVVLADSEGMIYILNFSNGRILKTVQVNGQVFSSPILHNDRIVVGCRDDNLYILEITKEYV